MQQFLLFVLSMVSFMSISFMGVSFAGCTRGMPAPALVPETMSMPVPVVSLDDSAIVPDSRPWPWWERRHNSRINNIIKNQRIVFIGDSITQGFEGTNAWAALNTRYNNRITNLGFSGDETGHVIWRLTNGEFPPGINPEYVVLMIGTNNRDNPESIAAGIGEIIRIINKNSPESKILLFSILPRGSGVRDEDSIRNFNVNQIIKGYNEHLNVRYIDIWNLFITDSGDLRNEFFTDRLHLTPAAYLMWSNKIMELVNL